MKILPLTVYKQYFESIRRGTKRTEYRDGTNDYWVGRLCDMSKYPGMSEAEVRDALVKGARLHPAGWTHVRFKNGKDYLLAEIRSIEWYSGHTTFAIKLGKVTPWKGSAHEGL